jgi:large subunit ribosomal protein L22
MGQQKKDRRQSTSEAKAEATYLRTSAQKLNLVAATIRGVDAGKALTDLQFNHRRIAKDVRKVLQSAVANAENNHGLDVDRLYVAEAFVGKTLVMKRFHTRGRGRSSQILKPFSRLTVIVRERDSEAKAKKAAAPKQEAEKKETKAPAKKAAAKKTPAKKPAAKKEVKE